MCPGIPIHLPPDQAIGSVGESDHPSQNGHVLANVGYPDATESPQLMGMSGSAHD